MREKKKEGIRHMARPGKDISTEEQIAKQDGAVKKAKEKYDLEVTELNDLLKKMDYIYVFDALRGIAAVLIFLNHCAFMKDTWFTDIVFEKLLHNGEFEVIFFFVLSGFCMWKKYGNKFEKSGSLKEYFFFAISKVKKFYLLYVMTMGYVAVYEVAVLHTSMVKACIEFLFSLTLTQTITVKYWGILNKAAWFLSALSFLYFFTPVLVRALRKVRRIHMTLLVCIVFYIVVNVVCYTLSRYEIVPGDLLHLFTYVFPIYWIPGYFLGMGVAKLRPIGWIDSHATALELGTVVLTACIYLLGLNIRLPEMGIFRHCFYIISVAWIIIVFSREKGKISEMLSKSKLCILGKYSLEIYLIHYPLITRGGEYIRLLIPDTSATIIFRIAVLFGMTLLLSVIAKHLERSTMSIPDYE